MLNIMFRERSVGGGERIVLGFRRGVLMESFIEEVGFEIVFKEFSLVC